MASALTHMPRALANYLRDGEEGLSDVSERLLRAASRRPEGKFGKREALYLPVSPFPPVLWRPKCGRCRFWTEGEPGTPGRCRLVGRSDDRFGGEAIHPDGVCGLYTPPAGEPPFAWLHEQLSPTGADSVRGRYRHPLAGDDRDPADYFARGSSDRFVRESDDRSAREAGDRSDAVSAGSDGRPDGSAGSEGRPDGGER